MVSKILMVVSALIAAVALLVGSFAALVWVFQRGEMAPPQASLQTPIELERASPSTVLRTSPPMSAEVPSPAALQPSRASQAEEEREAPLGVRSAEWGVRSEKVKDEPQLPNFIPSAVGQPSAMPEASPGKSTVEALVELTSYNAEEASYESPWESDYPDQSVLSTPDELELPADEAYEAFYDDLALYGEWLYVSRYGQVFRPLNTGSRWAPYRLGHWEWTIYGWTWVSDEPWGWACYHYGRWAFVDGLGWVWVPGVVWGPAWVDWRGGPDYMGWRALMPGEGVDIYIESYTSDFFFSIVINIWNFVPARDFLAIEVADCAVPVQYNTTVINNTTNIINITNIENTIINSGPRQSDVERITRKRLKAKRIEFQRGDLAESGKRARDKESVVTRLPKEPKRKETRRRERQERERDHLDRAATSPDETQDVKKEQPGRQVETTDEGGLPLKKERRIEKEPRRDSIDKLEAKRDKEEAKMAKRIVAREERKSRALSSEPASAEPNAKKKKTVEQQANRAPRKRVLPTTPSPQPAKEVSVERGSTKNPLRVESEKNTLRRERTSREGRERDAYRIYPAPKAKDLPMEKAAVKRRDVQPDVNKTPTPRAERVRPERAEKTARSRDASTERGTGNRNARNRQESALTTADNLKPAQ